MAYLLACPARHALGVAPATCRWSASLGWRRRTLPFAVTLRLQLACVALVARQIKTPATTSLALSLLQARRKRDEVVSLLRHLVVRDDVCSQLWAQLG